MLKHGCVRRNACYREEIRTFHDVPWVAARRGHFFALLGGVVAVLASVNMLDVFGPTATSLVLGLPVTIGLVVLSRRSGLSWADLGLARHTWRRGTVVAVGSILLVAAVYGVAAALPATHAAFVDARYQLPVGKALFTALVVIPIGTVIVEEIAFRGVLMGMITRRRGVRWGMGSSSALFGLWHILPSLGLAHVNAAVGGIAGSGAVARVGVVAVAVAFTAIAGLLLGELKRRSGSLLASAGLHWAVNGVGVLFSALLFAAHAA
jgi:membrane protease YdiL (CAAX protease family)